MWEANKIDLGVIGKPLKENFKSDLFYIPYLKQKIVIIAGKGSRLYNKQTIKLHELNDANFINRETGSETRKVFEEWYQKHICLAWKSNTWNTQGESGDVPRLPDPKIWCSLLLNFVVNTSHRIY